MINFSEKLINKMKDAIKESNDTKEDICFSLCKEDGNIVDYGHRKGGMCFPVKELKCGKKKEPIGFYHVLPKRLHEEDTPKAKIQDMRLANRYGMACTGTTTGIACFKRKGDFDKNLHNELSEMAALNDKLYTLDNKTKKDLSIFIYQNMKINHVRDLDTTTKRKTTVFRNYELSDSIINRMVDKIEKSKQIKKELGFDLCLNKVEGIVARNDCEGEAFCINTSKECHVGERYIGTFHTHPFVDKTDPSVHDIISAIMEGVVCIGSRKEIICYEDAMSPLSSEEFSKANAKIEEIYENFENVDKESENLGKKKNKLSEKYFEKIKID